jgi:hypothetical protein
MHMHDVEVSLRQWPGVPGRRHLPAALAQAVSKYRLRRDGVSIPVISGLVENAAYNANAQGAEGRLPCPKILFQGRLVAFSGKNPNVFLIILERVALTRSRTDGHNAYSGGWVHKFHSTAPHNPFEAGVATSPQDGLV